MKIANDKIREDASFESKLDFQVFPGRVMEGDFVADPEEERSMENQEKTQENPERDEHTPTPNSPLELRLTISEHDRLTRPPRGKAQIRLSL